jgi:hypothetical protein
VGERARIEHGSRACGGRTRLHRSADALSARTGAIAPWRIAVAPDAGSGSGWLARETGRARRCACCRRTIDRRPEHDLEAGTTICPREHFGLAWPRRTHGEAIVTLNALGNGPADVAINLVESTNNGTTWTDVSPAQHFTALGATMGGAVHFVTATALLPPRDHAAGVEYMYAIRMGRVPGSTTTSDVGVLSCVLDLYNDNRNGTTSPFDDDD